jgi:CubicO group peptidase (beta-lactamase class C family)
MNKLVVSDGVMTRMTRLARHVDCVIDGAIARERIVGTVVLVAVDGELVYHRAAGYANRETGQRMCEDTVCRLASVTKTIVSAAALAMVDSGLISLDMPVTNSMPEFRPKLHDGTEPVITVRHLLTHTSGLDYGFAPGEAYRAAQISNGLDLPGLTILEALRRLASVPLLFKPGEAWNYSLGTDVLGEIISRAGNATLPDVVRLFVTGPLGMTDTDFVVREPDRLAVPYADGMPRPVRMNDPHLVPTPAGVIRFSPSRVFDLQSYPSGGAGMVGTAGDFLTLLEAIRSGGNPILTPESAQALTTNALPANVAFVEPGWTFSLGAAVLRNPSISRTPHDLGTWRWGGAYGNDWFVNPIRRLSVVSFTNTSFEGDGGAYPIDLRDAIYYALSADE